MISWQWILFSFILSIVTTIFTSLRNKYCYAKGTAYNGKIVLSDMFHNTFSNHPLYGKIGDILFIGSTIVYAVYFLYHQRYDYIFYFILLANVILLINIVYACSTVLPDSKNGDCSYSDTITKTIENVGTCNDLNMSGHLMIIITALYTISLYQGHIYLFYYYIVFIVAFFCITVSRNHYTVDCLNSVFFTILILTYRQELLSVIERWFHLMPLRIR